MRKRAAMVIAVALVVVLLPFGLHPNVVPSSSSWLRPVRDRLALAMIRLSAARGRPEAQVQLAAAYSQGFVVDRDVNQAIAWYRLAAAQGHVGAQFALGETYSLGQGVPVDAKTGAEWWEKAAESGHFTAQYRLADAYSRGLGVARSPSKTFKWWRRMADGGNLSAKQDVAWALANGWGTERDPEGAVAIWSALAANGDIESKYQLGSAYAAGTGVAPDPAKAVQLWLEAGGQRQRWMPDCWHALCLAVAQGNGTPRDPVAAAGWCHRIAADPLAAGPAVAKALEDPQNSSPAAIRVAGTRQKAQEARAVLERLMPDLVGLARRGDAAAQYEVAGAQLSGLGAKYDPESARGWLEKAAGQGHEKAAETLAIMRHNDAMNAAPRPLTEPRRR